MKEFVNSAALLLVLLNPFLVIVYLVDVVRKLNSREFQFVLLRACLIASITFCCFAVLGESIFKAGLHADFASFQIFGGVVFLLIGIQFVFRGPTAIEILRGESEHLSGAIAMPILIGPGTISASVIIGRKHSALIACSAVLVAVISSIVIIILLKKLHDYVLPRKEQLIERYVEIAGRITALFVGTVSIEMIMRGLSDWIRKM